MAVAPLPNVRQVVEYALTEMPPEQIWLGVPTYGYDWPLPFVQGETRAQSIPPGGSGPGAPVWRGHPVRRDRPGALVPLHRRGRRGP